MKTPKALYLLACFGAPLAALLATACVPGTEDIDAETVSFELAITVPGDYPTIQEAVNAAVSGDTVLVAAGEYTENVNLKTGVHLAGAGADLTTLRGQISFNLSENVEIEGFRVTGEGAGGLSINAGIAGAGCSGSIHDNIIESFGSGLAVETCSELRVERNLIRRNDIGIELAETDSSVIANNQVLHNRKSGIVFFWDARADTIHNTVVGNGFSQSLSTGGSGIVIGPGNLPKIQNNIIVSNNGGLNAMEGSSRLHHNLIWGNVANYVGSAAVGIGDISLDPMFMDMPGKDYRLLDASPAVDAAVDWSVSVDYGGNPRPTGAAPDIGAFELQEASPDGDFVINEVMSNPSDEARGEYIELFNATDRPLGLSGLVIDDGDATDRVVAHPLETIVGDIEVPSGGYG